MIKLFVGGFPLEIQEIELAKLIAIHGDIDTIKIVRDKKTKICKGYAFVEMKDREGAENTVEALDGTLLDGKILSVKINEEPVANKYPPVYKKVFKPGNDIKKKRPRRAL